MVKGTVKGQFIIATIQGTLGAASIYIAGFHDGFFIFAIFLTAPSVIPLGSGIVTIPFGIGMMFFDNVAGGLFVVLFHIIGITNIDNFLRPILVPREARLDPALMLLSFSGIAMFGFFDHPGPGADDPDRHHHLGVPVRLPRCRDGRPQRPRAVQTPLPPQEVHEPRPPNPRLHPDRNRRAGLATPASP